MPSLHESDHDTSYGYEPPPTEMVGAPVAGGGDGEGGGGDATVVDVPTVNVTL